MENTEIEALETIPAGHKMAVKDICEGADVIKYGFRIGTAKEDIKAGQWVHTHNIKTALGDLLEYKYEPVHMEENNRGCHIPWFSEIGWKKPVSEMKSGLFRRLAVSTILQLPWQNGRMQR